MADAGNRFENASKEEVMGTVATHERFHNDREQIKLDRKDPRRIKSGPN